MCPPGMQCLLLGCAAEGSCENWPSIVGSACAGVSAALAAQTAFVCVLVFVVFFSLGSGPLPFLYMSEILSSEIKGKVRSLPENDIVSYASSERS